MDEYALIFAVLCLEKGPRVQGQARGGALGPMGVVDGARKPSQKLEQSHPESPGPESPALGSWGVGGRYA